jgi:hypothetical protein
MIEHFERLEGFDWLTARFICGTRKIRVNPFFGDEE